jgi:PAS domain S-box-containing protein
MNTRPGNAPRTSIGPFPPVGKVAEETLQAIVLGEVDALLVEGKDGPRVYTLKDASEPYRYLVERMSEAAIVLDQDGIVLYCNGRLADMIGSDGVAGHRFPDLVIADHRVRLETLLASGGQRRATAEVALMSASGTAVPVRIAAAPMAFDERPCIALLVTALDDIAALKASEAALRESEERLRLTQEAAGLGCWELDIPTGVPVWSPVHFHLHGLDPGLGCPSYEMWHNAVHPDDRLRADAAVRAGIDAGRPFETDYRVVRADGTIRWVSCRGSVETDASGRALRVRGISLDITERKQAEESLKFAKAEAERAVLTRSKFLAAASHDLRQPVQSLMLLLGAVTAHTHVTPPQVTKAIGLMGGALEGLSGLLNSILDVSRLDAGVIMPRIETVDLGVLLDRLSSEYGLLATGKGLRLKARPLALKARTDPALLERILRNLIENAIRYTHSGGILLAARRRGAFVRVDVIDTGIGIAADKQAHIFEEFFQVGNPGRDRGQGLGLGLSIVGRLARLLGTELLVTSREGRGSCFSLLLAIDQDPGATGTVVPTAETSGSRILIVEDDTTIRMGLKLLVESWGYEATTASSGEEALVLWPAGGRAFDAIVADHRLGPGLSGTQTVKEICARAGGTIPTLIVTGDTAPERISQVYASGFDIMHKPVGAEDLRHTLARLLHGVPAGNR